MAGGRPGRRGQARGPAGGRDGAATAAGVQAGPVAERDVQQDHRRGRILEETLSARFGGIATDYQLVEDEDPGGRPEIRLVVPPRLGPVEPAAVVTAFLEALGDGSGAERVMTLRWRHAGLVRVERRPP